MKPIRPSSSLHSRTACQAVREWVTLGLGTSAGIAFIWQSTHDPLPLASCGLLLFLCLTLLGHMTVLDRLTKLLQSLHQLRTPKESSRHRSA